MSVQHSELFWELRRRETNRVDEHFWEVCNAHHQLYSNGFCFGTAMSVVSESLCVTYVGVAVKRTHKRYAIYNETQI
jgi:hypothetical protein